MLIDINKSTVGDSMVGALLCSFYRNPLSGIVCHHLLHFIFIPRRNGRFLCCFKKGSLYGKSVVTTSPKVRPPQITTPVMVPKFLLRETSTLIICQFFRKWKYSENEESFDPTSHYIRQHTHCLFLIPFRVQPIYGYRLGPIYTKRPHQCSVNTVMMLVT